MPDTGQWAYGTRAEIQRRIDQTVSREELVARIERAVSPQGVARLETGDDGLSARWTLGKPRF